MYSTFDLCDGGSRGIIKRRLQKKLDRIHLKGVNVGYWNCCSAKQRGPVLAWLVYNFNVLLGESKVS